MKYREAKMQLFLSDARGVFIPRDFAQSIKRDAISGIDLADLDYLEQGPDAEHYWDTWSDVCDNAVITDPSDGTAYFVYQDGDCWLVEQGAQYNEGLDTDCSSMFVVEIPEEEENEGIVEYTAPSAWASYLINGDASGLEDSEIKEADSFVESVGLGAPIDAQDAGFLTHPDYGTFAGDCQTYSFFKNKEG
jgi:hypothetical protein